MIRTQISLYSNQKQMLDMLSAARNKSMSELVREALDSYLKYRGAKMADKAAIVKKLAGCMANSKSWDNVDVVAWQRELRHEKGI